MQSIPEGHWPKLIRADEHLASIKIEIEYYREGEPYRVVGKFDSPTEYVLRVERNYPPSPRLPLLIGECLNCLRSALDHLAYALVVKYASDRLTAPKSIYFPIFESKLDKKGQPIDVLAGVAGIPEQALAIIESHQPYHRGENAPWHPLALIARLTNTDKHRELLITGSQIAQGLFRVGCHGALLRSAIISGSFQPGAEIVRFALSIEEFRSAGCLTSEEMEVQGDAHLLITFDEPEPPNDRPVLDVLQECVTFTNTLIGRLDLPFLA